MIGAGLFQFWLKLKYTDVFDLTAFVYVYFDFTSLVIVVELCTVLRYEVTIEM